MDYLLLHYMSTDISTKFPPKFQHNHICMCVQTKSTAVLSNDFFLPSNSGFASTNTKRKDSGFELERAH